MNNFSTILIVDFGGQLTHLITRKLREFGVYTESVLPENLEKTLQTVRPCGVILSGSPQSVHAKEILTVPDTLWTAHIPILGICYGQQLMVHNLGGKVTTAEKGEYGSALISIVKHSSLLPPNLTVGTTLEVWMSHGDHVTALPEGFEVIAKNQHAPCAFIANEKRRLYGVQFHPEAMHTQHGDALLKTFVQKIVNPSKKWKPNAFIEHTCTQLREKVGNQHILCGLSGGVDSAVTACLLTKALGTPQVHCLLVNTGLMRTNETQQIQTLFRKTFHVPLRSVNAQSLFLNKLKNVKNPEAKRKIIGKTFIHVFQKEAKKICQTIGRNIELLAQGTIYPDVIESAGAKHAHLIKSHHNVGGLPKKMNMGVVEPLRSLFKDEVRQIGQTLGLPKEFCFRHPFPGTGLAVRICAPVTKKRLNILRKADRIFLEEIRTAGLYDKIWQAFAILLPVKTVGVMGDRRTYEQTCALRAVSTLDGMTAKAYPLDFPLLNRISTRIVNEVDGINRIVYDITSKPPGTIEWE